MKKGLTVLMAVLIILSMSLAGGSASANDLLIGREVQITGTGVINADLTVGTGGGYNSGMELNERISTPRGGFAEYSAMKYFSNFEVGIYNISNSSNSSTEIGYESISEILNAKRTVYTSNYALGSVMGMKANGDTEHKIAMFTDMYSMEAEVSGESIGKLKLFNKVVDTTDHHLVLAYDAIDLDGAFNINWSAFVEKSTYPASGVDWLGCP